MFTHIVFAHSMSGLSRTSGNFLSMTRCAFAQSVAKQKYAQTSVCVCLKSDDSTPPEFDCSNCANTHHGAATARSMARPRGIMGDKGRGKMTNSTFDLSVLKLLFFFFPLKLNKAVERKKKRITTWVELTSLSG